MRNETLQALRDRIIARLQMSANSRDRASAAGREVVAQCRQSDVETLEWVLSEIDAVLASPEPDITLLRAPRGEGEAEQGPRAAPLHRYVGQRSPEGYAVCEDCGARENTPAAARMCPAWSSEAQGEDRWEDYVFGPIVEAYNEAHSALRDGAQGEVWREVDDLLARLERFEYDAAGESEEYWRVVAMRDRIAARRGEGGGE